MPIAVMTNALTVTGGSSINTQRNRFNAQYPQKRKVKPANSWASLNLLDVKIGRQT